MKKVVLLLVSVVLLVGVIGTVPAGATTYKEKEKNGLFILSFLTSIVQMYQIGW